MTEPLVTASPIVPDILQRPRPVRIVRGPDGRPRLVRRGLQALAAMRANVPKVLRIGVIRDARIVEERVLRRRETVTAGPSEKAMLVIADANLPSRHPLFELREDGGKSRYYLTLCDGMKGRVAFPADQGGVMDIDAVRASGRTVAGRRGPQVALDDGCRGKIVVGDTTLLFQFVVPPPLQPRPQLPASVRGGWTSRLEPGFVASLAVALFVHLGLLCATMIPDWPKPTLDDILASDYSPVNLIEVKAEDLTPADTVDGDQPKPGQETQPGATKPTGAEPTSPAGAAGTEPGSATKPEGPRTERPRTAGPTRPANPFGLSADQAAKLGDELELEGLLDGPGDSPVLGIGREFDGYGRSVTNLAEAIRNMSGTSVGDGRQGSYSTMDATALNGAPVGPVGTDVVQPVGPVTVPDRGVATDVTPQAIVRGTVRPRGAEPLDGPGRMPGQTFQSVFARKRGAIEACYNNALVRDPSLGGDLVFGVTINQQGGVRVEVTQHDQRLDVAGVTACIVGRLQTMNFTASPPQGGELRVRLPISFIPPAF